MKSLLRSALVAALAAGSLHAQGVPRFINYQGRVTDSAGAGLGTGTPVNRKMIFRIFDAATGGNRIWSEEQTVTISNGEFSVLLGNGIDATYNSATETPRPSLVDSFTGSDRYLELVVDDGNGTFNASDTPIAPRQRLTSTAFAMRAATADSVAGGTDFRLKDANAGLGWYGAGRPFNGQTIDGPVLYGYSGGALGSNQDGTQTTALRWNGSGNVGIGTAAGSTKLTVNGALGIFDGATRSKNAGIATEFGGALIEMGVNEDATNRFGGNFDSSAQGGMVRVDSRAGQNLFTFYGRPAAAPGPLGALLSITSGGRVGIGTENPSQNLDVVGSIRVNNGGAENPSASASGGNGSRVILWPGNATDTPFGFGIAPNTLWSSAPTSATFRWFGGTTERMSLGGASGNLAVSGSATAASFTTTGALSGGSISVSGNSTFQGGINFGTNFLGANPTEGGSNGNFIAFGTQGFSEDFIGYAANTFYMKDSPLGGDTTQPNLVVGGKISAAGKSVTVGEEELRIVRGIVTNAGGGNQGANYASPNTTGGQPQLRGAGYSFRRDGTQNYTIIFAQPFSDIPSFTFTPQIGAGAGRVFTKVTYATSNEVQIQVNNDGDAGANPVDFHFIAIGPR